MTRKRALLAALACTCATGLAQSIVQQPANQTVVQGGSAAFSVTVSGPGPFRYQWQFNGTNLPSQNIITTVAGSDGTNCFSGDGGSATNATLSIPGGIAVDGAGDLLIADSCNNRVREVGPDGIVRTLAGIGPGCAGCGNQGIDDGDGGSATNASLWLPQYVSVDKAGDVFFTDDPAAQRVREIDASGIITTVALVPCVTGVVADGLGNLFVSDCNDNSVREYETNGVITTVAGNGSQGYSGDGGPATNATFAFLYGGGMAFDGAGNLYIADSWNNCVRKVNTSGIVTTVAGVGTWGYSGDGGPATNANLTLPSAVAVDRNGNLFIADVYNNRIRQVDTNGIITTVAGVGPTMDSGGYSGDGGPATNASLNNPQGVALDALGNVIVSDGGNSRVRIVALAGSPTFTLSNVAMTNAGQYRVIVTGSSGSVTSSVATLMVTWPTLISKVVRNGDGSVALSCLSAPNATNVLYVSGDLSAWQALSTNVAAGDGTWQFTDTNAAGMPARFYRFLTR